MKQLNSIVLPLLFMNEVLAAITVNKVVVRIPKPKDIGLIFDLSVVNTQAEKKEMLEFRIRSYGTCCINLTEHSMMSDASRLVGGNFGHLEPGGAEVVSLIWPTISLYNRVGFCPIILTSTNVEGKEVHQKQTLNFDTRFITLDPEGNTLRSRPEYTDCRNWDKEYLKNCTPVNCEERYFGQLSFYNTTSEHCEAVPRCNKPNEIYNLYSNECINTKSFFCESDIQYIRDGKFVDECSDKLNVQKTDDTSDSQPNIVVNIPTGGGKTCNTHTKRETISDSDEAVEQDDYMEDFFSGNMDVDRLDINVQSALKDDDSLTSASTNLVATSSSIMPYWLNGILQGLLIVFATVTVYVLICFVIFLIVTWISRRQLTRGKTVSCALRSPAPSEADEPMVTPSSLLSQR